MSLPTNFFIGRGGGVALIGAVGSAINTLDILGDGSCISCMNMDTLSDLGYENNFTSNVVSGGQAGSVKKWGTHSFFIPNGSTGDYIYTEGLDLSRGNGSYTISAWFYLAGARSTGIQPVVMMVSGTSTNSEGAITVAHTLANTSGRYYGKGRSNATSLDTGYETNIQINTGQWYQGVHVFDAVANTYKMYLNGSSVNLVKTVTSASSVGNQPVGLTDSSNVDILLGHEPDQFHPYGGFSGSQNIDGYIDQVRVFDRALSLAEVEYLHEERLIVGTGLAPYTNTNTYNFNNSQNSPTTLNVGLGTLADFDLEFELYPRDTTSNPWVLNNGGYNEEHGFLFGIYNPSVAVAGDGIGAYGYYATDPFTTNAWHTVKIEVRLSSDTISSSINGVSQGTSTGYSSRGIQWDVMNLGIGKSQDNDPNWTQPYDGQIRNITLTPK